jgi:hypothetical protein
MSAPPPLPPPPPSSKTTIRPTDFHKRKGHSAISPADRFRVITDTLSSINAILKDLKKTNYPSIKHRIHTLKRNVAIEIRKEVPDFNPENIINKSESASATKSSK